MGDQQTCDLVQEQFAYYMSIRLESTSMYQSQKLKPSLIWAQVDDNNLVDLAKVLVQVHGNPAGAVDGERNHKTNNRVRTKQRVRLVSGRCRTRSPWHSTLPSSQNAGHEAHGKYTEMLTAAGKDEEQRRIQEVVVADGGGG